MKRSFFLYATIVCLFTACVTQRNNVEKSVHNTMEIQISDTLKVSPDFRQFCRELAEEQRSKKTSENYIPSAKLQQKYAFRQANNQFFVRGYIHINHLFNRQSFEEIGGSGTVYTNEIQSFSIPVEQLQRFVQLPGITYIEVDKKVKLIK